MSTFACLAITSTRFAPFIAKHTKVDVIWVAVRNPTLVSHSLRGVAMNLKATTLTYLAIRLLRLLFDANRNCMVLPSLFPKVSIL